MLKKLRQHLAAGLEHSHHTLYLVADVPQFHPPCRSDWDTSATKPTPLAI